MDPALFDKYKKQKSERKTERGDLMKYFMEHINQNRPDHEKLTMPRMGVILKGLTVTDLYYMKAQFEDRLERNDLLTAVKHFWWSLRA